MKTEYKITSADAAAVLELLLRQVEDFVRFDTADEEYIEHIQKVIDALENADRIIILP